MVQILPRAPSLGELLGGGLSQGMQQGMQEAQKQSQLQSILNMGSQPTDGQERPTGQQTSFSPQQILAMSQKDPAMATAMSHINEQALKQQKMKQQEKQFQSTQEFKREETAEPKLLAMQESVQNLENEDMRFARMGELFSPENQDKFPSALSTAIFSKDGEIRPTAFALLSPEAQESIKLTVDQLTGAKDTFGARVTNFDVQTYMKRLPSLLNSPEGRRRVLRDLRLINKINRLHDTEVLNIIDEAGGAGKMPLSKAEALFKKKFKSQINDIRDEFINPNRKSFKDSPDPSLYRGQLLIDEETGQKSRSNGKEWIDE
jgi:hypothetical protein